MPGEIGKAAAEELRGKLYVDEQNMLRSESDEVFDEELITHLRQKLAPEVEAFNESAQAVDQLKLEKGSSLLEFFRDNRPAFAVLVKGRSLQFLDAGSNTPVRVLKALGGPDEYNFSEGSGAAISEEELLKGLIRTAVGAKFQAE